MEHQHIQQVPHMHILRLFCWRQVWDYIYLDGPQPAGSSIPAELLQTMRREFQFWCATGLRKSISRYLLRRQCLTETLPMSNLQIMPANVCGAAERRGRATACTAR